jgi:hypothetical protein
MNRTILKISALLCAFLCTISCDKLVNEYYDTPIPKNDLSGAVTEEGDSCIDFGWSPDGRVIVYTDGVSFVKKVDLSSGSITTLLHRNSSNSFGYFSPRITNDAVYFGTRSTNMQTLGGTGALCKVVLPESPARILQQFTAFVVKNFVVSGDGKKIACGIDSSVLVFDTGGILLYRINTKPEYMPVCFSQDNATLYISSGYILSGSPFLSGTPFFSGLNSFSLIDSSTTTIISGMTNEMGRDVSADSDGVRVLVETASTFVLRNLSSGTSVVIWSFTRPQSQFFNPYMNFAVYSGRSKRLGFGLSIPVEPYENCQCTVDVSYVYSIDVVAQSEIASTSTRLSITKGAFSPDGRKLAYIAGGRIFIK